MARYRHDKTFIHTSQNGRLFSKVQIGTINSDCHVKRSTSGFLAVQVARHRLENDLTLPERTDLSVCDIVDLLTLCLNATFLQ